MHTRISAALVTLVVCGLAVPAYAQEYCVTCSGPDAKYRCVIGGEPSPAARTSRGQLLCISELAQSGHHASCSVGRSTAEPCEGDVRTVMFPTTADPAAQPFAEPQPGTAPSEAESPALAAEHVPQAPEAPTQAPAQTVEELAKETVQTSGEGLEKAGEAVSDTAQSTGNAVGNAFTKTWKCMTSFFSDC